jgi:hypothetical protein
MFGVNISILRSVQSFRIFFCDEPIKEAHCQKRKEKEITIRRHFPIIKYVQKKKEKEVRPPECMLSPSHWLHKIPISKSHHFQPKI